MGLAIANRRSIYRLFRMYCLHTQLSITGTSFSSPLLHKPIQFLKRLHKIQPVYFLADVPQARWLFVQKQGAGCCPAT